jgi:lysyl-tRNA synthetase class 1
MLKYRNPWGNSLGLDDVEKYNLNPPSLLEYTYPSMEQKNTFTSKTDLSQSTHWADINANNIIRTRRTNQDNPTYVCASGITPSGTVHIGNFREIISVDLVVRALLQKGKKVRFIYSWDDYDVFRKVPVNMPQQEMLAQHLRWPITMVPDPYGQTESYARYNEQVVENLLVTVGIEPEYLYQASKYRASTYAQGMRTALEHRDTIRGILNEFRSQPLPQDWWPISVFSSFTNKDTTTILGWDGEWGLTYRCDETNQEETLDLRTTPWAKLPWRIDWPMRWAYEGVDFEPAGKDHHSEGGSFDTAKKVSTQVYGVEAPVTFQYDFISIKGRGGKISSSSGEVIGLDDVLEVYTPEVTRYLFAGTRPNAEFAISFDLDVIKIYEDYDRCERIYYEIDPINEKKRDKEWRIYELSQPNKPMESQPFQLPFRHLCNLLLIANGDWKRAVYSFPEIKELESQGKLTAQWWSYAEQRANCAWNWLQNFAPEDFVFQVRDPSEPIVDLSELFGDQASLVKNAIQGLSKAMDAGALDQDEKPLQDQLYAIARDADLEPPVLFQALYQVLVSKPKGPRLAGFLKTLGKDRVQSILVPYL